jgi:malate dehydrogenase
MNPAVSQLSLYDVANVKGVAADISHVNTKATAAVSVLQPARRRGGRAAVATLAGCTPRSACWEPHGGSV